ncbi:MAG: hypothetical protein QF707_00680 [Candidatus Poseidoniaceae archaeon]|jgi:hypothetical protein|nr:hypothetical protein [Candidatus Poseidoniaceae archaeon]MDP7202668.1 hypothetical protein [Candidatus Poseidoniaceae archaeon]
MDSLLTRKQFARIKGREHDGDKTNVDNLSWDEIEDMIAIVQEEVGTEHEVRLPSHAEWVRSKSHLGFELPLACEEILWDHPHNNNRGAPIDGRPRIDDRIESMMRRYRVCMKSHPKKSGLVFKSQTPIFSAQKDAHLRLLIRRKSENESIKIPEEADFSAILKQEALFALLIGIIPSFLIPVFRGYSNYAFEGWANLLFGGICFSLVSATIWRPRRPTWYLNEEGNELTPIKE